MVRGRRNEPGPRPGEVEWQTSRIGEKLLELRDAVRKAEDCRRYLASYGLSQKRWHEIAADVDPHLRFMVRPQLRDDIVTYLDSLGKPADLNRLVTDLHARGAGTVERIRQVIRLSLQSGRLERNPDNSISLPEARSDEFKKRSERVFFSTCSGHL